MMSRYRILEFTSVNSHGDVSLDYMPQYKLWGLIWIPIKNEYGFYKSTFFLHNAEERIEIHKKIQRAKKQKTKIIEID
jgi:hypothetical protein